MNAADREKVVRATMAEEINHPAAQCQGKFAFRSYQAAAKCIRRTTDARVTPYHCPVCRAWHLGCYFKPKSHRIIKVRKLEFEDSLVLFAHISKRGKAALKGRRRHI